MRIYPGPPATAAVGLAFALFLSNSVCAQQKETADQFVDRVTKAIEADEWGRAHSGIQHALALEPSSPRANFVAATVYLHEGSLSAAIECLTKALAAQPVYPEAHLLLARCLVGLNKRQEAREEVNTAIGQGCSQYHAYRLLGEIDISDEHYEAAIGRFETALQGAQPDNAKESSELKVEIQDLRRLIEDLKRFGSHDADQKPPDIIKPVLLKPSFPH